MTGTSNRMSCRQLFKTLRILPLQSQYIYSLLCLVVNNMDSYQFISDIHNRNTRHGNNLNFYQSSAHLSLYQKGTYYIGIRVFNSLPLYLKQSYNNCICFKLVLKDFLCCHSFYTLEEYFEHEKKIRRQHFFVISVNHICFYLFRFFSIVSVLVYWHVVWLCTFVLYWPLWQFHILYFIWIYGNKCEWEWDHWATCFTGKTTPCGPPSPC
jgi:hypothetical protein